MRKFKLPHSFPRLSVAVGGISLRQALGPIAASIGILIVLILFFTGVLSLNLEEESEGLAAVGPTSVLSEASDTSLNLGHALVDSENADRPAASLRDAARPVSLREQTKRDFSLPEQAQSDSTIGMLLLQFDPVTASSMNSDGRLARLRFDQWMASTLASIRRFDLVAVHGLPFAWEALLREKLDANHSEGDDWGMVTCDPQVAATGGQQVAFLWNQTRIHCDHGGSYLVGDRLGRFAQPPMVGSFEARLDSGNEREPFRFTLIHALPSNAQAQSSSLSRIFGEFVEQQREAFTSPLEDVYLSVRRYEFERRGEDDLILVGQWGSQGTTSSAPSALTPGPFRDPLSKHLVELVSSDAGVVGAGASKLHLLFDRRYSTEYTADTHSESAEATHPSGVRDLTPEFKKLGFTQVLSAEFALTETPQFESVATEKPSSLMR